MNVTTIIKCKKCGHSFLYKEASFHTEEVNERSMGKEILYEDIIDMLCPNDECKQQITGRLQYWEYPEDSFNYSSCELENATGTIKPVFNLFYRQSRDTFIRSIGEYGYIFSQLTKHDRTYTQEGRAFLEVLSRDLQHRRRIPAAAGLSVLRAEYCSDQPQGIGLHPLVHIAHQVGMHHQTHDLLDAFAFLLIDIRLSAPAVCYLYPCLRLHDDIHRYLAALPRPCTGPRVFRSLVVHPVSFQV